MTGMRKRFTSGGKLVRAWMFMATFLLVFGVSPAAHAVTPASTARSISTMGPASVVGPMAAKACADAPVPAKPSNGLPGMVFPKPDSAVTGGGDPFKDPGVNIADVYGYSYKWQTYDTGCLPNSDMLAGGMTGIGNATLAAAATVNAATHQEFTLVVTPTWLEPLDNVIQLATDAVRRGFFTPWFTPVMLLVACAVLWAATRADISSAVTTAGWAVLVLVATTYVMSYPVASVQAVDGLVQMSVTTAASGVVTAPVPYANDQVADQPDQWWSNPQNPSEASPAQVAINQQMNEINKNTLYTGWLMGTFGSATSTTALTYGPDLFKASHLSWDEVDRIEAGTGDDIVPAKKKLWEETAAKVLKADGEAYGNLTGQNGRWEAMLTTWMSVVTTLPFLAIAGVLVIVAYGVIRLLVPLAPVLGVFGMLLPLRGWVMGVLAKGGRFIVAGPLFWAGSLVNLFFLTAIFQSDIAFVLKYVLALAIPILLFSLLMPKNNAASGIGRMLRSTATRLSKWRTTEPRGPRERTVKHAKEPEDTGHEETRRPVPAITGRPAPLALESPAGRDVALRDLEPVRPHPPAALPAPGPRTRGRRRASERRLDPSGRPAGRPREGARPQEEVRPHEPISPDELRSRRPARVRRVPITVPEDELTDLAPPDYAPFHRPENQIVLERDQDDHWVPWMPDLAKNDAKTTAGV